MSRRRSKKQDSCAYQDWLEAAYQDRLASELLITDERLYKSCAFHCQQCAEKALKAYLLFKTNKLVDGHNLTWLCKQAIKIDKDFTEWLDESTKLNHFYIETRYPSDFEMRIKEKRIKFVLNMAQNIFDFISNEISNK